MKRSIILLVVFVFIGMNSFCQSENEWTLKKDKNAIKVYTRQSQDSDIIEIKVICSVKASVTRISDLIADIESYPEWMPDVKTIKIVEQLSDIEKYYYIEINAPWPVYNRDNIIHYLETVDSSNSVVKISVTGVPDYLPENDGIVRVVRSHGVWQLTPTENGETEILSTYLSDPSGSFPVWVVKLFIVGGIYNTFVNLKGHVEESASERKP